MASNLASLRIAIETGDLKRATSELDKLEKQGKKTEKATDSLTKQAVKLGAAYLSVTTAINAGKAFIELADEMTNVNSKLKLVTQSTAELAQTQQELFAISQQTRTSFTANVDLYQKMAMSTKELNLSQKDMLGLTSSINKAMIVSGTSTEGATTLITQLGQAFSSNFQAVAQELGTIRDQAPALYQQLLIGTGKTTAEFKKMAEQGQLTSQMIIDALQKQSSAIDSDFGKMTKTVGQSLMQVKNSTLEFVDTVNNVTDPLSGVFTSLSEEISIFSGQWKSLFVSFKEAKDITALDEINIKLIQLNRTATELIESEDGGIFGSSKKFWTNKKKQEHNELKQSIQDEIDLLNKRKKAIEENSKAEKNKPKDKAKSYTIGKEDLDYVNRYFKHINEQTKKATDEKEKNEKLFLKWYEKEATKTNKRLYKNLSKTLEDEIQNAFSNIRDFSDFEDALGSSLEATFSKATAQFASDYITIMSGNSLVGAVGGGVAGAVAGMAIQSLFNNSNKETSEERINREFEAFMDGLNEASDALNQFGNVGSSISNEIESITSQIEARNKKLTRLEELRTGITATTEDIKTFGGANFEGTIGINGKTTIRDLNAQYLIDEITKSKSIYEEELDSVLKDSLASQLDFTKLSTEQLELAVSGITDLDQAIADELRLNELALEAKLAGGELKDYTEATAILTNTNYKNYINNKEAVELLADAEEELAKTRADAESELSRARENALATQQRLTETINREMIGSLSYLSEVDKLAYANNLYQNAITQEDRVSSARSIAELSKSTTRTREEYAPIFNQYIEELQKQREDT
jgi:tape measure domain-containing protein